MVPWVGFCGVCGAFLGVLGVVTGFRVGGRLCGAAVGFRVRGCLDWGYVLRFCVVGWWLYMPGSLTALCCG